MWGNVNVTFFAYNNAGKKGIGCGLNGVQKIRDGEELGGQITAQEAFKPVGTPPAAAPAYAPPAVDPITGQPVAYTPTGMPVAGI